MGRVRLNTRNNFHLIVSFAPHCRAAQKAQQLMFDTISQQNQALKDTSVSAFRKAALAGTQVVLEYQK